MCGRYGLLLEDAMTEVFPTQSVPVRVRGEQALRWMTWGFPRSTGKGVVINGRAETALQKPMFCDAVMHRRVAVPAAGFYEWQRRAGVKQKDPYWFTFPDGGALWMAGVYTRFEEPGGGSCDRFVILTTQANASVAGYHDRMPVLLRHHEIERWLAQGEAYHALMNREPEALRAELRQGAARQQSFFG